MYNFSRHQIGTNSIVVSKDNGAEIIPTKRSRPSRWGPPIQVTIKHPSLVLIKAIYSKLYTRIEVGKFFGPRVVLKIFLGP
jgi:hypothetical protein